MSRFFKYIEHCPNVAGPLPDDVTEGDSDSELELETLFISDSSTEIVTASIEIVTVPPSDDETEELETGVPALTAAEVSESSGDEGEYGADDERDELDGIGAEERKSQQGDDEEVPNLEDVGEEEDEFTKMWRELGLQPDRGQVDLVKENRQKVRGRIDAIWQELRLVIIEAFENNGGMLYSEEEHHLKQELALVTNMSLILEQRLELLQLLAMEVEFSPEY
jgi:hypothetical protein